MGFPEFMRKYLPVWMGAAISSALLVGYYVPHVKVLKPAIPFLLFLMLYPMMINLKFEEIGKALKDPKLLCLAVLINFLCTPLLGALWAHFLFGMAAPYLAAGFILKVSVPCSGMVAAWTGYAKGKVESALIVVALSLAMAVFLVPFWMWALAGVYVSVSPVVIFKKMLLIVVLPLAAGVTTRKMLVRRYGPERYKKMAPYFPAISTCGMIPMVFVILSSQARLIISHYQGVISVVVGIALLYPLLFLLAILLSKATGMDYGNAMALGYSVTAKNHAITIGVATVTFGGTLAVLPAAVAPVIQIPIMLLILHFSPRIAAWFSRSKPL